MDALSQSIQVRSFGIDRIASLEAVNSRLRIASSGAHIVGATLGFRRWVPLFRNNLLPPSSYTVLICGCRFQQFGSCRIFKGLNKSYYFVLHPVKFHRQLQRTMKTTDNY